MTAVTDRAALRFIAPPPGLAPHTAFALEPVDASAGLFSLTAMDEPGLRVFVVDRDVVVPDYAPVLTAAQLQAIGLASLEGGRILLVARPTDEGVTVNLLAPVVVDPCTGIAAQVILEGQDLPVRALLG